MLPMSAVRTHARRYASLAIFAGVTTVAGCSLDGGGSTLPPVSDPATQTYGAETGVTIANMTRVSPQLYTQDVVVGTGRSVAVGDSISVFYSGRLTSGFQFDANVAPAAPVSFVLDTTRLIKGWVNGLPNARVGGTRRMVIGPSLAYGYNPQADRNGRVTIPRNSVLVFDVQIVSAVAR